MPSTCDRPSKNKSGDVMWYDVILTHTGSSPGRLGMLRVMGCDTIKNIVLNMI